MSACVTCCQSFAKHMCIFLCWWRWRFFHTWGNATLHCMSYETQITGNIHRQQACIGQIQPSRSESTHQWHIDEIARETGGYNKKTKRWVWGEPLLKESDPSEHTLHRFVDQPAHIYKKNKKSNCKWAHSKLLHKFHHCKPPGKCEVSYLQINFVESADDLGGQRVGFENVPINFIRCTCNHLARNSGGKFMNIFLKPHVTPEESCHHKVFENELPFQVTIEPKHP